MSSSIASDFNSLLVSFRADAEAGVAKAAAKIEEIKAKAKAEIEEAETRVFGARRLVETVPDRALKSFDMVGRLNALGAERVVQVGRVGEYLGVLMFVVDERDHGTLLAFGSTYNHCGFYRPCWCCVNGMRILEMSLDVARSLRSWDLGTNNKEPVMSRIREAVEAGEWAWIDDPGAPRLQKLAPLLNIEQKDSSVLKLMGITPKEWWPGHSFDRFPDRR